MLKSWKWPIILYKNKLWIVDRERSEDVEHFVSATLKNCHCHEFTGHF